MDDFKLAGPSGIVGKGWELIKQGLKLEPPTGLGTFLGCRHHQREVTLADGSQVKLMEQEMHQFMRSCVKRYEELAPSIRLKDVDTPFLPEDQATAPAGTPVADSDVCGGIAECGWCRFTFPANQFRVHKDEASLEKARKERKVLIAESESQRKEEDEKDRGRLAPVAASIVMKILYCARFVRMDVLRIVGFLATAFTRWTPECHTDAALPLC